MTESNAEVPFLRWKQDEPPKPKGRLLFVTAASGMGKTTTCMSLHHRHGFTYYEGDCFLGGSEPYPEGQAPAGPTRGGTRPLPRELLPAGFEDAVGTLMKSIFAYIRGGPVPTPADCAPFLTLLADDVRREWDRIGGDFVVAFAIYDRPARDLVRKLLADLNPTVVVLHGSEQLNAKRLLQRHERLGEAIPEQLQTVQHRCRGFEAAGEDEPNTVGIELAEELDADAVADLILERLKTK